MTSFVGLLAIWVNYKGKHGMGISTINVTNKRLIKYESKT